MDPSEQSVYIGTMYGGKKKEKKEKAFINKHVCKNVCPENGNLPGV